MTIFARDSRLYPECHDEDTRALCRNESGSVNVPLSPPAEQRGILLPARSRSDGKPAKTFRRQAGFPIPYLAFGQATKKPRCLAIPESDETPGPPASPTFPYTLPSNQKNFLLSR